MRLLILLLLQAAFVQSAFAAAIHEAAKRGDKAKIIELVKSGVNPDLKDQAGNSPLLVSVIFGQNLFEFLTSASPKSKESLHSQTGKKANHLAKNNNGQLWYHLAVLHCNHGLWSKAYYAGKEKDIQLQNIFHYIAKSNCNKPYEKIVFYNIQKHRELLQQRDRSGKTPLQVATMSGTRGGQAIINGVVDILESR